jgi:hypothetical protein
MTRSLRTSALTIACLLLGLHAPGRAADKPVKMANLPKPVQTTMREQSKGAKFLGMSSEVEGGKTLYELETMMNGHHRDLLIDGTGKVVEIEVGRDLASLPAALRSGINQLAPKEKVTSVESLAKGDGIVYAYEVHVTTAGKKRSFQLTPDGKLRPKGED